MIKMDKFRGIIATGIGWITGFVAPVFDQITKQEIIFWLQTISFIFAIVAAIYTIRSSKRKKLK